MLPTPKKRGRKPKYSIERPTYQNNEDDSEKEDVILCLPITIDDINDSNPSNLFIKSNATGQQHAENLTEISSIAKNINFNNIETHVIKFDKNTRCWWCHHSFETNPIQLPENYMNSHFTCIGNFCSFNCVKAYNLNLNDMQVEKRNNMINVMYYQMYNKVEEIVPAPHWITLKDYGGVLTIDEFRDLNNTKKSFVVLNPPITSRQMQIEESYKLDQIKSVNIKTVSQLYNNNQPTDYVIKRNKELPKSHLNLEKTLGLRIVSLT